MARSLQKAAKDKADKLFSRQIRSIGHCEHCGSTEGQLQCAHWISRRYNWTRTDHRNAFCLDAACHRFMTDHPTEFGRWAVSVRGEDTYQALLELSQRRDKFDWIAELDRLKQL